MASLSNLSSLRAFLATAKRQLQTTPHTTNITPLTCVVGNPSADLDSIVSSVLLAFFQPPQIGGRITVPLLNIPQKELRLRSELKALLRHANIEEDHLTTLSNIGFGDPPDTTMQPRPEHTQLLLVDHNALTPPLSSKYKDKVIGCIDHHSDENVLPKTAEPKIIQTCGSCTSLVLQHVRSQWDSLSSSVTTTNRAGGQVDTAIGVDDAPVRRTWDAQIAKLALAPILADTSNLEGPQTTEVDREGVRYLEAKIAIAPKTGASFDRKAFFEELTEAKKDITGMSLKDLLGRDYKEWEGPASSGPAEGERSRRRRLGISSTVKGLRTLSSIAKQDDSTLDDTMIEYAKERELDILVLMTKDYDEHTGEFQRELVLCSYTKDEDVQGILSRFLEDARGELGLEPFKQGSDVRHTSQISKWRQTELGKTRKQVAPLLRNAMRIENS